MSLETLCSKCKTVNLIAQPKIAQKCIQCQTLLLEFAENAFFEGEQPFHCPVCSAQHLYRQKDFNRAIGLGILLVGVLLSFFTYGISLIIFALFDWWLYRRIDEVGCCYKCGAIYREYEWIKELQPFNLEMYDYYKNLKGRY